MFPASLALPLATVPATIRGRVPQGTGVSIMDVTTRDVIRRVRLTPYARDERRTFELTIWATGREDCRGQSILGYRLAMRTPIAPKGGATIFEGEDFAGSPLHADDSDATVAALMGFLTLRPGDTDAGYFDGYDRVQRDFCAHHAESLASYCADRFGSD